MANTQRLQKIADQIQRELAEMIARELRDPRVGFVTLTAVDVSADRAHATVFFTCLEASHAQVAQEGLNRAAGFLRTGLARRIKMFTTPTLRFRYDESVERGVYLSGLIESVATEGKT